MLLVAVVAFVCVAALVAACLIVLRALRGTPVDVSGGFAASDDGTVQVHFAPDEVDDGTRVELRTGLGGQPPPADVLPLLRPFEITPVRGHARTGTVTVRAVLPPDVAPELVVILVDEEAGWRVLKTAYDPTTATATAVWPHFSRGLLGFLDPLAELGRDTAGTVAGGLVGAGEWSGEQFDRFAGWARDRSAAVAKVVAAGAVAALGGTLDNVTCSPSGTDWAFRAEGTALLTGCAGPADGDAWPSKVGNRAPYPMLVTLPNGVSGPGARELFTSMDLEDAVVTTLWGFTGRTVVPAGKSIGIGLHREAGAELHLRGHTDYSTLAVKVVALVALVMSAGETVLVRQAVKDAIEQIDNRVITERLAGRVYGLADAARDTAPDSDLGRALAATNAAYNAHVIDEAFAVIGLVNCAIASAKSARDLDSTLALMFDTCFPPFVEVTVRNTLGAAKDLADPRLKAKLAAELAKGLAAEALNIRKGVTAIVAEPLSVALPRVDLTGPELVVRCTTAACAPKVPEPTQPSGPVMEVYVLLTAVDTALPGSVTYDQLDWFWSPDAARACAQDGEIPVGAWCTDYYYRNLNTRLRTATLSPTTRITFDEIGAGPAAGTPAQLAAQVRRGVAYTYKLRIVNGEVVELGQVYTP